MAQSSSLGISKLSVKACLVLLVLLRSLVFAFIYLMYFCTEIPFYFLITNLALKHFTVLV